MCRDIKPETMSRVAIILCVAFFATTANSSLLPERFQAIRTRIESIVSSAISTIKSRFEPAKEKALDKFTKLEEDVRKFSRKVTDDVSAEIKKARERVKSIAQRARGIDVSKCTALVNDELDPASAQVYSEMSGCAVEKVKIGANYVDSMKKNTDIVSGRLSELREEGERCGSNVTSPRTALQAVVCIKLVAAKAAWTAAKVVPSISGIFVRIDYLLATLRVSLSQCSPSKTLAKFSRYASDVIKRAEKCVQQQIAEGSKPSKNETTQPPKSGSTAGTGSSTSGSEKGSTTPSYSTTTASSGLTGEKGSSGDPGASTSKPSEQSTDEDSFVTKEKDRTTESSTAGTEKSPTASSDSKSPSQPGDKDTNGDAGASTSKPSKQSTDKDPASTKKPSTTESSTVGTSPGEKIPSGDIEASTSKPSEQKTEKAPVTKGKDGTTESSKSDSKPESTTENDTSPTESYDWPGDGGLVGETGGATDESPDKPSGGDSSSKTEVGATNKSEQSTEKVLVAVAVQVNS